MNKANDEGVNPTGAVSIYFNQVFDKGNHKKKKKKTICTFAIRSDCNNSDLKVDISVRVSK